jgi:hypothetical protein
MRDKTFIKCKWVKKMTFMLVKISPLPSKAGIYVKLLKSTRINKENDDAQDRKQLMKYSLCQPPLEMKHFAHTSIADSQILTATGAD